METKLKISVGIGAIIIVSILVFYIRKEFYIMLDLYVGLVSRQRRTCNPENKKVRQVPNIWREAVLEDLKALGLDADGYPIPLDAE